MANPSVPPRKRGCLFYGSIVAVVLLVFLLIGALLGLRLFKKMINQYTDTAPAPLPTLEVSSGQFEQVKARVDAFKEKVRTGRAAEPLDLTADDINAMIARDQDLSPLKGKVYVTIQDGQLKGQVSAPMDQVGLPMFRGRYLNGTATFSVSLRDGTLTITPQRVEVKGQPLPETYMQNLRKENLAARLNMEPGSSNALYRLQDIKIQDGKLVIVPKTGP